MKQVANFKNLFVQAWPQTPTLTWSIYNFNRYEAACTKSTLYLLSFLRFKSRTLNFQKIFLFASMIVFQKWWKMIISP